MTNNRRFVFPALLAAGVLWGTTVPLSKVALGWMRAGLAGVRQVCPGRRGTDGGEPVATSGGIQPGHPDHRRDPVTVAGRSCSRTWAFERTSVTCTRRCSIGATPVLVAIAAAVLGHSVARPLAWAGFALSLAGVGFIAGGHAVPGRASLGGDALVLGAQLISAGFTVSQARLLRGRDPIAVTALQLMAAGVAVLPIALITEHHAAGPASPARAAGDHRPACWRAPCCRLRCLRLARKPGVCRRSAWLPSS